MMKFESPMILPSCSIYGGVFLWRFERRGIINLLAQQVDHAQIGLQLQAKRTY